jgi:signal transduction histidine kinase
MKKLTENALVTGIPAEVVSALEKKASRFNYPPGQTIFSEGDAGDQIYLLESGVVQVLKQFQGDRVVLLEEIREGDFFGELALIDQQGRSATARAACAATGWSFDVAALDEVLGKGPDVAVHFLRTLATRMRHTNTTLVKQKEASERLTLLGNMVGSIVHDLKNPLAAMRMSAELLEMKASDAKMKKIAELLLQQIDRLTAMITDLLEFARNRIELKTSGGRVDDIVRHCADLFGDKCRIEHVDLQLNLNAPRAIELDPTKFERVMLNLMKNAVQALKERKDAKLKIETSQSGNETRIVISDNGPGVPESIRNMLFEPFVTSGKKDGTGLGLSIVRKIIEAHGGKVNYETETDKGTTFRLILPG